MKATGETVDIRLTYVGSMAFKRIPRHVFVQRSECSGRKKLLNNIVQHLRIGKLRTLEAFIWHAARYIP